MKDVGNLIKQRLRFLGVSQPEFSRRLGKSSGWAGARFFRDVYSSIRHLAEREPQNLARMLETLGWSTKQFTEVTGVDVSNYLKQAEAISRLGPTTSPPESDKAGIPTLDNSKNLQFDPVLGGGRDGKDFFFLVEERHWVTESVRAKVSPGDYLLASASEAPADGDLVVAKLLNRPDYVIAEWDGEDPDLIVRPYDKSQPSRAINRDHDCQHLGVVTRMVANLKKDAQADVQPENKSNKAATRPKHRVAAALSKFCFISVVLLPFDATLGLAQHSVWDALITTGVLMVYVIVGLFQAGDTRLRPWGLVIYASLVTLAIALPIAQLAIASGVSWAGYFSVVAVLAIICQMCSVAIALMTWVVRGMVVTLRRRLIPH